MKTKLFTFLVLVLAITFSCSKKDVTVKVVEKNFAEEITVTNSLNFTFNNDLVPDSLVNMWIDDELLKIKPHTEGKFMWTASNKIVFVPAQGFKPATDFTCEITSEVLKYMPDLKLEKDNLFSFHTPYLMVSDVKTNWAMPSNPNESPQVKINIRFNQNITPQEVAEQLEISIDEQTVSFDLVSNEVSNNASFIISDIENEDKDLDAEIKIRKGLGAYNGSIKTTEDFEEDFLIPSPFKLHINDVQSNHDGTDGIITIHTTQEVNIKSIKNFITIDPSIKYTVETFPSYFLIKSNEFSMNHKYELSLKKGLLGKLGGKLKQEYSQPISFGELKPSIQFVNKKEFYVSGNGDKNIEAAIVNVPKVRVKITKVYENNIVSYIKDYNFRSYNNDYDDYYYYDYNRNDNSNLGDVIYEKEIETKTLPRNGNHQLLNLDFEDKLSDYNGIYLIEISSPDNYYLKDKKLISISDIGLIVKEGENTISVFANSIKTAEPLSDVEIKFIGSNNQINSTLKTNAEGIATYEFSELKAPGFKTNLITVQHNNDFNFIPLRNTKVATSRFDVGGNRKNPSGLETFIYGDRDIYRPGETMNISAIIRDYEWKTPGELPVILKIRTPNGKTLKTARKILNKNGAFELQVKLQPTASTGSYSVNIFTSNNVLIGSKRIKVEEFMPDRIKVKVSLNKKEYKPNENINVNFEAVNFFGPPAANRNYQIELSTKRKYFYSKENRGYNYNIEGAEKYFERKYWEGETDEAGKGQQDYKIPISYKNMGVLQSDIFTTVFDETGRPVNRLNNVNIYTQDVFLGIKYQGYYTKTGQPVKIDLIAVDKDGKALDEYKAKVKLIKYEYKTVLSKSGSYFRYRSEKIEKILDLKAIDLKGTSSTYSFIPEFSGNYELRISLPGAQTYVKRNIYAYGWGSTTYSSFQVDNEGQIDIQLDKEKYLVGEKANVILKAPFSGKMLITVETNKVLKHFYVNTDKRAASFELDISEEHIPNVYISATLFRPHEKSDMPLTVAHGFAPVMVENTDNKIPITISAVEKSESNKKQTIKIKAKPNSALTIAVVDEGILQVTGFSTPDPYNFFYQRRALEVNTYDIYPFIFPELEMMKSHTGGGGPAGAKRLNPLQNKRVKLVSFWSGIIETNSRGEAEYVIDIPQFSGDLRIMAVNYSENKFGSAFANMKVADPIVVSTALPRFLSPKDSVEVPVILTNTTENAAKCKVNIEIIGPIEIIGKKTITVNIEPNSEQEALFRVYAKPKIGEAKITIKVDALNKEFINETDITVRPASPLQKRFDSGVIEAGKTKKLKMNIDDFIESSIDNKLIVSNNPLIQFTNSLDYLVRYPYGCVEQTVSTAFPQLYFDDLINITFKEKRAKNDAAQNVQIALDKIKLMQLYNGGLTYWPGHGSESWWGSVYAAHFAFEAKKAGYDVDQEFLDHLFKYLKMKIRKKEFITYYYNSTSKREIAPKEVAYSLYVLALAGEKPISTMNYYKARLNQLSLDGKYMLAAAYALTGDTKKYKEILPNAFEGEKSNTSFGGSFYSYIRDEAIALNTLLEIDPTNSQIGVMSKHISDYLKNRKYLNTQERAFSFLAMGKIAKIASESDITGTIMSNGKKIGTCSNSTITLITKELKGTNIEISTEGTGQLYYFWETEGISASGKYLEEDNYIQVRKSFYDRYGQKIYNNTFKQNDLVLVELAIQGLTTTYVENVVISDILPAGFEIENPRITTLPPGMSWPHNRSNPDYQDIRDDRINLFVNVRGNSNYNKTAYYYYLVRAVSRGNFQMGPVGADAMYNGEYHSYSGGGTIKVLKK
ncbi:MAG: alpha-2-macroglobulin family protein [Bacteroidales bacterium]|nr:alpha-2-macroglobulin family protein [Bacteroidales bacterium]